MLPRIFVMPVAHQKLRRAAARLAFVDVSKTCPEIVPVAGIDAWGVPPLRKSRSQSRFQETRRTSQFGKAKAHALPE